MNGSANLGICCGRLFFHPCKIDASALKGRTDRCYDGHLLIGHELKILTAIAVRNMCLTGVHGGH